MGLIKTGLKAAVAVKAGHMVHDRIQRRKQAEWEAQGNPPGTSPPSLFAAPQPPVAAVPDADLMLARLTQLGQLRDQGILTDEEFDQQKAVILGG